MSAERSLRSFAQLIRPDKLARRLVSERSQKLDVPYVAQTLPNHIDSDSCGAAVLSSVYQYYGLPITEGQIYGRYGRPVTGLPGMSELDVVRDATERGFEVIHGQVDIHNKEQAYSYLRSYKDYGIPVIVTQEFTKDKPWIGHYRVVVDVTPNSVTYHDPYFKPNMKVSFDEFLRMWQIKDGEDEGGGLIAIYKKPQGK